MLGQSMPRSRPLRRSAARRVYDDLVGLREPTRYVVYLVGLLFAVSLALNVTTLIVVMGW